MPRVATRGFFLLIFLQHGNILKQLPTYAKKTFMPKACYFLILWLFTGFTAEAQSKNTSLLWEISGNGLQNPSYLFGTFHIMCKADFPVSDILIHKIKSSRQFYGELKMDDPNLQSQMMLKMMMAGKTLQSLMSEAEYKTVSENFQAIMGMPISAFNNFKPFMALSLLAIQSISCLEKVQPETEFVQIAKANNLSIMGLETIDDQMNAIDKQPLDSQVNALKQSVLNFDSVKNVMAEMINIYKQRDIDSLYSFMKRSGADDVFEQDLLIKRNKNWIPVIIKAIAINPSFFAVGAGHLAGSEGLISLLRKQGYTVTPVKY